MNAGLVNRTLGLATLLIVVAACWGPSVRDVRLGKDSAVTQQVKTFNATDTVYAVATIRSAPENARVRAQLVAVDAVRVKPGLIHGLDMTIDLMPGMEHATFNFTAPPTGWPDGKYRFEILLLDGAGAEKARGSADFTTTGGEARLKALLGQTK
jgi:hypothetical protein